MKYFNSNNQIQKKTTRFMEEILTCQTKQGINKTLGSREEVLSQSFTYPFMQLTACLTHSNTDITKILRIFTLFCFEQTTTLYPRKKIAQNFVQETLYCSLDAQCLLLTVVALLSAGQCYVRHAEPRYLSHMRTHATCIP